MDQPKLLTRDELIVHRKLFETGAQRALLWLGISAIPMGILICVIAMIAPEQGAAPVESPLWSRWLAGLSLLSMGVGAVWFIFSLSRLELQLRCPSCRTAIGNPTTLLVVMACSRCPKCESVIVGPTGSLFEPRFEDHLLPSCEQFESSRTLWTLARWATAGIVWSVVTKLLLDHWAASMEAAVGEVVFPFVRVIVGSPGIMIFGWGFVRAYRQFDAKADKCPQCHESISGQIAALTGCCSNCGHVVRSGRVAPVDNSAIAGKWTRAKFQHLNQDVAKRIEQHVTRRFMIAFTVLFGLMFMMKLWGEGLALVLTFIFFGWFLRGMWQADQMAKQVQCPHCAQPLLRHRRWVIASCRCGGCGERVLADALESERRG